jgi:uncharacterized protein (TIGR02646 family)
MIHVDRNQVATPAILSKIVRNGKSETDLAIEHYTNWDGVKQYSFSRYKHDDVKGALETLFHGKCAYCESSFHHVAPEDIEHWRPKGAVILEDGTEQKPAYYWLAATWDNLLPSCIHCNRRQRQEDVRNSANSQSGKKNFFPVANEAHRWTHHTQANHNGEEPLILDPCFDLPEQFLSVSDDAVVIEKEPDGTVENQRARASIDVYGLNRKALVDERKTQRDLVVALFDSIRLCTLQLPILPAGTVRDATRKQLLNKLSELKAHQTKDSRYLLMKAPMIDEFIQDIGPELQNLGVVP